MHYIINSIALPRLFAVGWFHIYSTFCKYLFHYIQSVSGYYADLCRRKNTFNNYNIIKMKKLFYLFIVAFVSSMSMSFTACSSNDDDEAPNNINDSTGVVAPDSTGVDPDSTTFINDSTVNASDTISL